MDFNKLFSQSKKGEKSESKFQYILIDNDRPTLFQWENWTIGHLYCKIVRDIDLKSIILSDLSDKEKYLNAFLDYHSKKYNGSLFAFTESLKELLKYIKHAVVRNRDIIEVEYEERVNRMIYNWIDLRHKEENISSSENELKIKRFRRNWDKDRIEYIYCSLITEKFIDSKTDRDSFYYYMGATNEKPDELIQINWIKNKELLRTFVKHIIGEETNLNKENVNIVSCVFRYKGSSAKLAKPKRIITTETELLLDILRQS